MKRALACAGFVALVLATPAHAACRQALALGLDVSGSVDAREYRLQMNGLADALSAASVRHAILAQPGAPMQLLVFEWSGPNAQHLVLPWTAINDARDLDSITSLLRDTRRRDASPGTALGEAMQVGARYLGQTTCWVKTLDISGDGKANLGARPRDVKPLIAPENITINALVIGADAPAVGDSRQVELSELSAYFRAEVIVGDDAFVETAIGFDDYAAAMTRKLEREIEILQLSSR